MEFIPSSRTDIPFPGIWPDPVAPAHSGPRYDDDIEDPCPTGVLLFDQYTLTRNNAAIIRDVIAVWNTPTRLQLRAENTPQHLTHSGLAVVNGHITTGGGGDGLSEWRADLGSRESGKAADGLVTVVERVGWKI